MSRFLTLWKDETGSLFLEVRDYIDECLQILRDALWTVSNIIWAMALLMNMNIHS